MKTFPQTSLGLSATNRLISAVGSAAALLLACTAIAQTPPANDRCPDAIPLTNGVTHVVNNMFYATELGDPRTNAWDSSIHRGVWYTFGTTNARRVNLTTCASDFDTRMAVYTGACGVLTETTGNDNAGPYCQYGGNPTPASVTFISPSTPTTYYVLVGASGPNGNLPTSYTTLRILLDLQDPPANDRCPDAIALTNGVTHVVNNMFYATELGDPRTNTWDSSICRGVWYTFGTTNARRVNLTTCASDFDTRMAVYNGACGVLTETTGNDNAGPYCQYGGNPTPASVTFISPSTPTTYYVLVGASGPNGNLPTSYTTLRILLDLQDPPANDRCPDAIPLTNGVTHVVNNMFYATELGDPRTNTWDSSIYRGVWYTVTSPAGARLTIGTCGSDFDTRMAVFTGSCEALTEINGNDNNGPACGGSQGSVNFYDVGGRTYYILVGANSPTGNSPAGNSTLRIVATVGAPTNDTCTGAIELTAGAPFTVNTLNATEADDPTNCVPGFGRGIWYTYTPTVNSQIGVSTCGSAIDTGLSVYSGNCGALANIQCNDDGGPVCPAGQASINFNGVAGTRYYFMAGGKSDAGGNVTILVTLVDLVSTNLYAVNPAGGGAVAGRTLSIGSMVTNQGINSIGTYWTDRLTLSSASTNIVFYSNNGFHSAVAGGSYRYDLSPNLGYIPPGTYLLTAETDLGGVVAETNENNNIQTLTIVVTNLPPTNTLVMPSRSVTQTTCIPLSFRLTAQAQAGSYPISRVEYFDDPTKIGESTNRAASYRVASEPLAQGFHSLTAQAVDLFGYRATSQVATVTLNWPELHRMHASLATNGEVVCCMGAQTGSNYVVQASTIMRDNPPWQDYLTNRVVGTNILIFTNRLPLLPQRYFRTREEP